MKTERLLQSQGFGSRKECRSLIRSGALCIDGQVIDDPFVEVDTTSLTFEVRGETWQYREKAYLMLHKPANYECSHKPHVHPSVYALLPLPLLRRDVQCVGRLDQDTTGLMLLSDDGQFIHVWSSGKKRIPKTYEITTSEPLTDPMLAALLTGVQLHDDNEPIRAVGCEQIGACALRLTVTEGKYHQVKRMVAAVGNHVVALHRSSVGGLPLDEALPPGAWRWLDDEDLTRLGNFEIAVV